MERIPMLKDFWQQSIADSLLAQVERELDLHTPSPKGRYDRLMR